MDRSRVAPLGPRDRRVSPTARNSSTQAQLEQVRPAIGGRAGPPPGSPRRPDSRPPHRDAAARPSARAAARSARCARRRCSSRSRPRQGVPRPSSAVYLPVETWPILVAPSAETEQDSVSAGYAAPDPLMPASSRGTPSGSRARSQGRARSRSRRRRRIPAMASASVAAATSSRPATASAAICGPLYPRIVEPGTQGVGSDDLAVAVLGHERARAVEDAGRPAATAPPRACPSRCRLLLPPPPPPTVGSPMNRLRHPIAFEPPPTQAEPPRNRAGDPRPHRPSSWAAASSPSIRRWRSRTIVGYGCGPIADPST